MLQTSLNYFDHGNWMWTEAAWGGSYNHRGDIPLPAETIVDFWNTDQPANKLNGTGYEEMLFRDRMAEILQAHPEGTPLFLNYDSKVAHCKWLASLLAWAGLRLTALLPTTRPAAGASGVPGEVRVHHGQREPQDVSCYDQLP